MDFNKPRVSLWYYVVPQTSYRNDGACLFLSYNFRKILDGKDAATDRSAMHAMDNVVHLQPNMPLDAMGKFDLNILVDHGEDGLNVPLDFELPHPSAYWIADSHISGESYQYRLNRAKQFDFVFASHSPSIEKFRADGINVQYMPWAAEHTCYKPYPIIEKWDWAFIGYPNNPDRIELLDRFVKEFGLGETGYMGWRMPHVKGFNVLDDAAKKLSQARICVNEALNTDLNMRVMEILACKRFLLTEEVPDLLKHFADRVHLRTFKTIDEAVEIARYYLAHPDERNAIAEAGYKEFLDKHTYMHRAKEILKVCLGYEAEEKEGVLVA